MRVLFATTAGAGHFYPLVPFARAVRRAGHEVVFAAPRGAKELVERAGLPVWPFHDPPPEEWGPVMASVRSMTPEQANETVIGTVFARIDARAAYPSLLATIDEWAPDVIVRESCEFASAVAAELRRLPQVRVGVGLSWLEEEVLRMAAAGVDELRAQVGLPRDPGAQRLAHAPFLTSTPAILEEPWNRGPAWIQRYQGVAPAQGDSSGERLVYVSFGSVAPRSGFFPELYRAAIDALADLDATVLVGVGMQNDPADLAPLPPNVLAQRWFNDRVLLGRLAAIVHHGGFGTTLGAAAAGVPAVVVPLFGDQPYNAARIHALGAGLAVDGPFAIGDAVRRVLDEPGYRAAAGRVAAAVRELPPVEEAVDALLAVARRDLAA